MLIILGATLGFFISIISFWSGFYLCQLASFAKGDPEASSPNPAPFFSYRRKTQNRKAPKAVSEEEQYRKEQKATPADPGL